MKRAFSRLLETTESSIGMLRISLAYKHAKTQFTHAGGPLEFGRGPERGIPRHILHDPSVSGDQLRLEEGPSNRLRLWNLSKRFPVRVSGAEPIDPGMECEVPLPARLTIGETLLLAEAWHPLAEADGLCTVERPFQPGEPLPPSGASNQESVDAATLTRWFEAVLSVQRASVSSGELYQQTAKAVVELIGLDRGIVLLCKNGKREIVACHNQSGGQESLFSQGVVDQVCEGRRTFYQDLSGTAPYASLLELSAVVAAPILNDDGNVAGVVYGTRLLRPGGLSLSIRPLEAKLVQVLATAVQSGLARAESESQASRRRIQFEQFFSPELSNELDRDPSLLEGKEREITIMFSDIRGFSRVSERLAPAETCQFAGEVMDRLTVRVLEYGGVVVSYYGDGMLAMWNAPTNQPQHATLACHAASAMIAELPALDQRWHDRIGVHLGIGIGINTGRALVGNTGSRTKFMYGPQGHAVNLASRVEGATKQMEVPVLLTGSTHAQLQGVLPTRRLCQVRFAGIDGAVELYELHTEAPGPSWLALRDAYESALGHYEQGQFAEACRTLYPLATAKSEKLDFPSLSLVGRCIEYLCNPKKPFDPIVELIRK